MIRIGSIVLRVDDLERQTAFWMAALDLALAAIEWRNRHLLGVS